MYTATDYRALLKMFFERRGKAVDKKILTRLNDFSDEEISTLYEMVFTKNEKTRKKKVAAFHDNLSERQHLEKKEREAMVNKMQKLLDTLEELGDKYTADVLLRAGFTE